MLVVVVVVDGILELQAMDWNIGSPQNLQRTAIGSMLDVIAQHGPTTGLSLALASKSPAGRLTRGPAVPAPCRIPAHIAARLALRSAADPGRGAWKLLDRAPIRCRPTSPRLDFAAWPTTAQRYGPAEPDTGRA